ncbi:hypothetical protein GCM10009551_074230 [Nocardiopsis tropica]|uniref:hypothetical protein n=1 Tax=Tsukamurella strandjordii TaxID=147577 RepID=UPI0031E2F25F
MRDPSTSPEYLRVERDMHVSGLHYEFASPSADRLPWKSMLAHDFPAGDLWLSLKGAGSVAIRFADAGDEEERTHLVADQVQDAVLDSAQVVRPARTWPRAERGGSPLWARLRDGVAVWESVDGSEIHRVGELPAGR